MLKPAQERAQDIANAVKSLAIVLPAIAILPFALAVFLARGRRRRTLRTSGWCFVLIGVVLLLIRRVAGNQVVDVLVKVPSNKPAAHQVWNIATSLLFSLAVALIAYGIVIAAAAWLADPTRPATAVRKSFAPSLRDSPAVAYSVVGGLLLLLILWGPTPAFRTWALHLSAVSARLQAFRVSGAQGRSSGSPARLGGRTRLPAGGGGGDWRVVAPVLATSER